MEVDFQRVMKPWWYMKSLPWIAMTHHDENIPRIMSVMRRELGINQGSMIGMIKVYADAEGYVDF